MITQAVYSVHSLPLGALTEFFVNRGIETLSPAGFYAIEGVYWITSVSAAVLFLIAILSANKKTSEKFGSAFLAILLGGAAALFALLYAELYLFRTGTWIYALAIAALGAAYRLRRNNRRPGRQTPKPSIVTSTEFDNPDEVKEMKWQDKPVPARNESAPAARNGNKNPMDELDSLIGLSSVKKQILTVVAFAKNNKERIRKGLPSLVTTQHIVFTGNPGTGKTTVARIIGEIYKEYGILRSGHFVEIGGRDLVAEWIGQTTSKVEEIVAKALDGILFIDEAYALLPGDSFRDFGPEALAKLIQLIDNHRDRIIVIMAGYEHEMDAMLKHNPGLITRMKTRIHFPDYTAEELHSIFEHRCKEQQFVLTREAREKAKALFADMHAARKEHFGNGRAVRNAFERCAEKQAMRLYEMKSPSKKYLQTFVSADIPALDEVDW